MPSSSTLLSSSTSSTNTLNTLNTSTGGGVGSKGYQSGYMMGTSLSSGGPQESDEPLPTRHWRPFLAAYIVLSSSLTPLPAYTPHHEYLVVPDPSVFGYPPDKYAPTLDFFLSLSSEYSMSTNAPSSAGTTQPESLYDVGNAFKLGTPSPLMPCARYARTGTSSAVAAVQAGGWSV
ncbi:hypothetical protein BDZ89DRAFT_1121649 [Hymenopellis radicata]|nr:hypothetical protein BDZ89DRAFT_1121649 [Hymenopellis radicata]